MTGRQKLYFLLNAIDDAKEIAPSGQPLKIDPTNDLNRKYSDIELEQLFSKLEKDENILKILQVPSGISRVEIVEDLDPYDPPYQQDDGYWHIELLPSFDSYFSKIQNEPEYQEFTGKKPASVKPLVNNGILMTYEQKLDLIVKALIEAKKATRKGQPTKLYLNETSGLDRLDKEEVRNILLQLQDENALKVNPKTNRLLPIEQQPTNSNFFFIDILEGFDNWYENYLMGQKTDLENLDFINMLKIYDVVLDINEQIQLTNKTTVSIHLLPSLIRFSALFPADTIGIRDKYCENRWDSLSYLKTKGIINSFEHDDAFQRWETIVTVYLKLSSFDSFYKEIQGEYVKRNKSNKVSEKPSAIEIKKESESTVVWSDDFIWEGDEFILGKYGSINFTSDDRKHIFKILTDKKGDWATINELKGDKDAGYVRSTIKQIEDRFPKDAKEHIKIISTQDDDTNEKPKVGAYRIKITL